MAFHSGTLRDRRTRGLVTAPGDWSAVALRPYQEAALCAWELSGRRGLVVLPTGSGKTRVALAAMARTGLSALCLVPTRVLLEQWLREIRAVYADKVGCFGDGHRDLSPVTVATFESAYRHMDRLGNRFDWRRTALRASPISSSVSTKSEIAPMATYLPGPLSCGFGGASTPVPWFGSSRVPAIQPRSIRV